MGRHKKLSNSEKRDGFIPGPLWGVKQSPVWKELTADLAALGLYLLARSRWNGRKDSFSLPYKAIPGMSTHKATHHIFTLVRLGLLSKENPGGYLDGKRPPDQYAISDKWREYDPARPGVILLNNPYVTPSWKKAFNPDGTWKDGYTSEQAPRSAAKIRAENSRLNALGKKQNPVDGPTISNISEQDDDEPRGMTKETTEKTPQKPVDGPTISKRLLVKGPEISKKAAMLAKPSETKAKGGAGVVDGKTGLLIEGPATLYKYTRATGGGANDPKHGSPDRPAVAPRKIPAENDPPNDAEAAKLREEYEAAKRRVAENEARGQQERA